MSRLLLLSLPLLALGCGDYQHGVDLFKRDDAMAAHEAELARRHPQVQARVLMGGQEQLAKRATPTTYAATLTQVNVRLLHCGSAHF
jgi:hypothetical protein